MGKLSEWADEQSPFIRIADGESVTLEYTGFSTMTSHFDPDKEVIQYKFLVDGEDKFWETGSQKVARAFDVIEPGMMVTITRDGEGQGTKYTIIAGVKAKAAKEEK